MNIKNEKIKLIFSILIIIVIVVGGSFAMRQQKEGASVSFLQDTSIPGQYYLPTAYTATNGVFETGLFSFKYPTAYTVEELDATASRACDGMFTIEITNEALPKVAYEADAAGVSPVLSVAGINITCNDHIFADPRSESQRSVAGVLEKSYGYTSEQAARVVEWIPAVGSFTHTLADGSSDESSLYWQDLCTETTVQTTANAVLYIKSIDCHGPNPNDIYTSILIPSKEKNEVVIVSGPMDYYWSGDIDTIVQTFNWK